MSLNEKKRYSFALSIQGPHAVGKSSLVQALAARLPNAVGALETVTDLERQKADECLDMSKPEDFCLNQKRFIHWEVDRARSHPAGAVVVVDRGPDATEFYTLHWPIIAGVPWDSEALLAEELSLLREYRANQIIYLTAPVDELRRRASCDTRSRPTMERWLTSFEPLAVRWFAEKENCLLVDTAEMTQEDVVDWCLSWLHKEHPGAFASPVEEQERERGALFANAAGC